MIDLELLAKAEYRVHRQRNTMAVPWSQLPELGRKAWIVKAAHVLDALEDEGFQPQDVVVRNAPGFVANALKYINKLFS